MIRGVGLRGAISINVIAMIGIGPLITIPLVVGSLHGGLAITGWVVGAIIALCDGLVWAELSSRYPGSGGTYVYLREAFGRKSWGRLFAFLFNWQFFFSAPLLVASGYIGFAQYAGYLFPGLNTNIGTQHLVAASLGIIVLLLLYRRVTTVSYIASGLAVAAVVTLIVIIVAGSPHIHAAAFNVPRPPTIASFILALGAALVITLYDYAGYSTAPLIGDEVITPARTIPRAIVISIAIIAALYILLQISVLSVVPWQQIIAAKSQFVAASAVESVWGVSAARAVTILILITAFASTYAALLGFSRIPYAAALDDEFFPVFARLHPRGRFPYISLLVIGLLTLPACFFTLDAVISFLTAGIVLIQSVAQIVALFILRSREDAAPFRMWLYPLPAVVALVAWAFIFYSSGISAMLYGVLTLGAGVVAYIVTARVQRRWPFAAALAIVALVLAVPGTSNAAVFGSSAVVIRDGRSIFTVDRKPFFLYGAAFFYERIPRTLWKPSLLAYKSLGINTIDLYLIWNWHELSDGNFDFSGRTNARRDLRGLLRLIHELGFHTVIRPGPVIRNEWRNGGYP
ncbi:MAG: amino acid permease, partial [Candidatus Eremiobacteraeota bacterium]|nr:amino acid permease [Candidatus Eremiobacteraeota bacterium]